MSKSLLQKSLKIIQMIGKCKKTQKNFDGKREVVFYFGRVMSVLCSRDGNHRIEDESQQNDHPNRTMTEYVKGVKGVSFGKINCCILLHVLTEKAYLMPLYNKRQKEITCM